MRLVDNECYEVTYAFGDTVIFKMISRTEAMGFNTSIGKLVRFIPNVMRADDVKVINNEDYEARKVLYT